MASNLGTRNSQNELQKLQLRQTLGQLRGKKVYEFRGPFHGFSPDLPHNLIDETYYDEILNLVVKSGPGKHGEVIMNDAGFERANAANLPLGDLSESIMVISAGDGSNAGSQQLWTIAAAETAWREIPASGAAGTVAMKATVDGNTTSLQTKSLLDFAEFPLGAAGRTAHTGAVSTPAFVFTNNVDNVMIFPAGDSNQTDYEELTDRFNGTFRCISVESYNDRAYFLNTVENDGANDIRYRNRIRRSARGTCDPLETTAGAGSITVEEFTIGLKLLTLGDILVAYFSDGVAFIRDTFNSAAPNAVQIVSPKSAHRGLLGTHAAVEVPGLGHFGIYNDGWWMLDSNGRFTEIGTENISSQGRRLAGQDPSQETAWKWKRTFYNELDSNLAQRIHCTYESKHNWVRIVVPISDDESKVWIWDANNNRVFRSEYAVKPTVYGKSVLQLDTAEAWSDQVDGTDTWSSKVGTWDTFAAEQGEEFILHGDVSGAVFIHRDDIITYDGADPAWQIETVDTDFGDLQGLKRLDKVDIQHVNAGNFNTITITAIGSKQNTQAVTGVLDSAAGQPDDIELSEAYFTGPTAETIKIRANGSGGIQIRGYMFHTVERGSERHDQN
jgi:hypothetical protein